MLQEVFERILSVPDGKVIEVEVPKELLKGVELDIKKGARQLFKKGLLETPVEVMRDEERSLVLIIKYSKIKINIRDL